MACQVYTFLITYDGLEDRIWRKAEVSSNYRLDQLGYLVLAAFDTMACHLFEFRCRGEIFSIPDEEYLDSDYDMMSVRLKELNLQIGESIQMDYDFGTTQTFHIKLLAIEDMIRGWGNHYPYLLDGAGRGILDDYSSEDLRELIDQIDRNGHTDEPFYYKERLRPWDYRHFDLELDNALLKGKIVMIADCYLPFWED